MALLALSCPSPAQFKNGAPRRFVPVASSNAAASSIASDVPWQKKALSCFTHDTRPIILFDGVCNLCNGGVNFVLDADPEGRLRFAALQSSVGRSLLQKSGRSPDDISSIVLVEKQRSFIKSEAVLKIAQYLNQPYPSLATLAMLFPLIIRDPVYDLVASNRYLLFGQTKYCRTSDARFKDRFLE